MACFSWLLWGLLVAIGAPSPASAGSSVNVDMKAAFPRGPYLLELLETAAGENATSYFPLLDTIASGHFNSAKSDSELYTEFLNVLQQDGHITAPEALATFNLALSLRSAAPRIEAHYQYYSTAVEPHLAEQESTRQCQDWALLDAKQYCTPDLENFAQDLTPTTQEKTLPFDRVIGSGKHAILYADPLSASFGSFHKTLMQTAQRGELSYRLRYRRSSQVSENPLMVSGYGVELALKRTDYIVIDDRETDEVEGQKHIVGETVLDEEEVADLKPLSTSELASLSMKAASFILQSENPFETLVKVTQDFPKFSSAIALHEVSEKFAQEQQGNVAAQIPAGINFIWMNGVQLIERQIEPFSLVELIRRERKLMKGVRGLGFDGKQAISLLGHPEIAGIKSNDEPVRFDWRDEREGGKAIIWLNDLENDARYEGYQKDFIMAFMRTHPGQLAQVGSNLFHVIAPVDFVKVDDLEATSQLVEFVLRGLPLRFGLVPLNSDPKSVVRAKVAHYLAATYGSEALASYFQELSQSSASATDAQILANVVKQYALLPEAVEMTLAEIEASEAYEQHIQSAKSWTNRMNANTEVRPIFANGRVLSRDSNWIQNMGRQLSEDQQVIQRGIYFGTIQESENVSEQLLGDALAKRNSYIFPDDDKGLRVLNIAKLYEDHAGLFDRVPKLDSIADSTKENWAILHVVADMSSEAGRHLVLAGLKFRRNNPGVRLEIIHNSELATNSGAVNGVLKAMEAELLEIESVEALETMIQAASNSEADSYGASLASFQADTNIAPGTRQLILNGRVIGPIDAETIFNEDDFQQLLEFEQSKRILPVYAAIDDLGFSEKISSPLAAAKITSITALSTISDLPEGIFESAPNVRTSLYDSWNASHSAVEVGDPSDANIHIVGLLNPASEQGQRWAPIFKILSELDGVYVKLFMNPREVTGELPIKRFFRYALTSKPAFDDAGNVKGAKTTFKNLPSEALLTAGMDVPPAWLTAAKVSVHDLDNIKLSSVKGDVEATYELEHILIEGHSREGKQGPPKGAQLALGTESDPVLTDTIVMANLGYFQFKANPGLYNIELKEGRSSEIFTIESVGARGYSPVSGDEGTDVALIDFKGTTLYPRLKRKPGKEEADVLSIENEEDQGIVAKGLKFAEGLLSGSKKSKSASAQVHADINIFSVASGHLYERMLNIMMVSVMRNTKHTVKFWFIEQFLSPEFKEFIPHMAAEYGFKYEMVTYKWPHWLRQQKEKQREIWGYKILFLDVLFPLSLDKVIFVDADQIVRTDMMDLINLDLDGAPYGFTPMCDSRTEMEGFRFWKQGYWNKYLRGLPYHISALYVVDLKRFREIAAGDRLRQQYHQLSADPGSLSNLDQDLPNHMQFQIPIHSLPQEWLWCETWCSDESLAEARTIDLCNNPQTKEPKLDRARRQVPEWTTYDDEIAALDRRRRGLPTEATSDKPASAGQQDEATTKGSGHIKDEL